MAFNTNKMGFGSSRRSRQQESTDTAGQTASQQRAAAQREQSTKAIWNNDIDGGEQHFGIPIGDLETLQRLQIHENTYGDQVHEWIDEGMTAEIMGKPLDMEAFRERQAERPPEVPTNIERQNKRSVQRSEKAAADSSVAGETGVPDPVRDVISSTGRSLDASIQRVMEDRMSESFGDVQIHTGSTAAAACEAINARAFTVGNHVAFNQGEYDPESPEGQHVLAHELAHVRQQTGGAVSMLPQEDMELEVDPDPALEREAEETAQRVMAGGELGIQRLADTEVHVQRKSIYDTDTDSGYLSGKQPTGESSNSEPITGNSGAVDTVDVGEKNTLKDQVSALTDNQKTLAEEVEGLKQTAVEKVGVETGKGAIGGLGAIAGTALLGPGIGTLAGGVAGGMMGGVYERTFDAGAESMAEMSGSIQEMVDKRVEQVIERYLGSWVGSGDSQGVGQSRGDQ